MTFSSLAGLIIAVAFATSIPMYADGALKRVVAQTLMERAAALPAGSLLMRYQETSSKTDLNGLNEVGKYIKEDVPSLIGFPFSNVQPELIHPQRRADARRPDQGRCQPRAQMAITSMTGARKKAELTQGRWFTDQIGR